MPDKEAIEANLVDAINECGELEARLQRELGVRFDGSVEIAIRLNVIAEALWPDPVHKLQEYELVYWQKRKAWIESKEAEARSAIAKAQLLDGIESGGNGGGLILPGQ